MKRWLLVCYDIRDPKRLRRVAQLMEGHGTRVQYSVFRCHLSDRERERLRWELARIMEPEDAVLFVPLCPSCSTRVSSIGAQPEWETNAPRVIIV